VRKSFHGDKSLCRSLLATAIASTLAATVAVPTVSWAQTAEATLRGKAPADSEVTARNVTTGATRRTKAGADGSYTLVGLPPGTYRVDAGPGTETTVTLTVASTATLDLQPAAAAVAPVGTLEEVVAKATRLIEVKTSEVGTTVSVDQIATVPQITRNFLEFADTVPGVVFSVDSGGNTSLRGGAMNNSSVNVYIDGVGQKNYVKEGGVSGQFFSQGNPFPQLAIGEYKVITSNYKAEFDQISSAAVTAETKSGTNEFHGDVFGTYTSDNFRAETPSEAAAGKKTSSKDKEYGLAIGGPIIQDKMHFYVTYEGKKYDTPVTVVPGVTGVTSLLPAGVAAQFGPASLTFKEDLYFGKIDWEVTDYDRLELTAKVRIEDQLGNAGNQTADSAGIDTKNNDTRISARWQHSADRWFNELMFTHEDAFSSPSARGLGNGFTYTYQPQQDHEIITVGPASGLSTQNKGQRGPGLQDDLTLHDLHWMGDHTLKMGVKFKQVTLTAQDAENINPHFYFDVNPTGTAAVPYKAFFTNPVAGLSPVAKSKNDQFGVYFQDDWAATERLTWNLGLRWDYERSPSYLDHVTPANVLAALNGQDPNAPAGQTYAQSLAKGGINVSDYFSTGSRSAFTNEWQPRLGFSFDLNADQRHVVFGGIGRSYDRNLFDYLQLETTKATLPQTTIFFNVPERPCTASPTCVAWDPKYLSGLTNLQALVATTNAGQEVDAINNRLKVPYSDQLSIGMRNRLGDWNTSATLAYIHSKDGLAFSLGNRRPDGSFWLNGGQPWGNGVPGFGALILGYNGIETKNKELLLSADKPYTEASGWGATLAYTFTDATQNRDINEHYSFDQVNVQAYPFIASNAAAKHRLVATGTIRGPWQTIFAAKLTLATPIPVNNFDCSTRQPNGSQCLPVAGRPDNTFGVHQLDLQATKNFEVASSIKIYLRVDLLNAFNWKNYSDYLVNFGAPSNQVQYNYTGNITGVTRTLRLTVGSKF
jgi:outer membrane receptor protein involved in Fe transport